MILYNCSEPVIPPVERVSPPAQYTLSGAGCLNSMIICIIESLVLRGLAKGREP